MDHSVFFNNRILIKEELDDPVGAISAHGVVGIWGVMVCMFYMDLMLASELALCLSVRVPQVSKVRFSLAPWMLSLHPWWVLKLFFIVYSLKRFRLEGSSFDFS